MDITMFYTTLLIITRPGPSGHRQSILYHSTYLKIIPGKKQIRFDQRFNCPALVGLLSFRVLAKNRYTSSIMDQKQVHTKKQKKSHARSPAWPTSHRTCFRMESGQVHMHLSTSSSFRFSELIKGRTLLRLYTPYTNAITFVQKV